MKQGLNLLSVGKFSGQKFLEDFFTQKKREITFEEVDEAISANELTTEIKKHHACLINNSLSLEMHKIINHRSLGSHFLDYVDFVENRKGALWGDSLFSEAFFTSLLQAVKNQDFKGSVIFLGENPKILPTLQVLAKFGFEDFDFLNLSENRPVYDHVKSRLAGLLNTTASSVDSAAFVRSQKEYSLCFVLYDQYNPQILEDMSYFHFLSTQSMVFDLSGRSNFLFKEVKALGVEVFEHQQVEETYYLKLAERLMENDGFS